MPRRLAFIFVLLWTQTTWAQGWADYQLQIDPQFKIVRANSLDVVLCRSDGIILIAPQDHAGVGPICAYAVTPTHVLTRHYGRVPRNQFPGDTLENVDTTKTFFFVTTKVGGTVSGPFDEKAFLSQPAVQSAAPVAWVEPANPNVPRPIALAISIVVLGWPILLLLLIAGLGLFVWRRRIGRRRHQVGICPKCGCVIRTPNARQCFSCGHDWHPRAATGASAAG